MKNTTPKPSSISDFQKYFATLYSEKNKTRDIGYLFSYLFRNISYLSRSANDESHSTKYYLKSISWLFAISNNLNIDIDTAIKKKFPGVCPYCIVCPCSCFQTGKKPAAHTQEWTTQEALQNKYLSIINSNPHSTIDKTIDKINEIYPANRHIWVTIGPVFHFSKILEELGEIHEAYTGFCKGNRSKENIAEELADVLAWMLSAWSMLSSKNLSTELITYYYEGCPVCKLESCICEDYSSRGQRLVKLEELEEFNRALNELLQLAPQKANEITQIINSINTVIEKPETTSAKRVINQGIDVIEKIDSTLGKAEGIGEKISSIAKKLTSLASSFEWLS
ncbi:MazG-like family protein [Pseudomonas sp. EA_35y_Pfl2_R111]|uniref:MazG-like family protein n=1 Tax=Pseudomonas sp. EA_35y_Pfl2_R111 TaxID=3088689 RepID=UPI0030DCAA93